jgi:uncharacterized protein (DUF1499 family)
MKYFSILLTSFLLSSCVEKNNSIKKWDQKKSEIMEDSINHSLERNFLDFLNNYQVDSLNNILADNFQLTSPNTVSNNINKKEFLGEYLKTTKAFNGKYDIIKVVSENEPKTFLIKDQSDYLKFLEVESPIWKITIMKNANSKIEEVRMDTTANYNEYGINIQTKEQLFNNWLKKNYPKETLEILHNNDYLLLKRMKSYSENK